MFYFDVVVVCVFEVLKLIFLNVFVYFGDESVFDLLYVVRLIVRRVVIVVARRVRLVIGGEVWVMVEI